MGVWEIVIIVCGGSLVLVATIVVSYLFLKNRGNF